MGKHILCVAPMMDWTDRHCRVLHRIIAPDALLYTEMVVDKAILAGDVDYLLAYDESEHPLALQLGGSDPAELAAASRAGQSYAYDEINLNLGCPSDRVQNGAFGAALMKEPARVNDCVKAMLDAVDVPVSVKIRLGVDEFDSDTYLHDFVAGIYEAGCRLFIVHARKAWLSGLSPKDNREIPPLEYDRAETLKKAFPDAGFVVNGGIREVEAALALNERFDGIMLGREAYHNPMILASLQTALFPNQSTVENAFEVIERYIPYIEQQLKKGLRLSHMTRHMLGLFQSVPGARQYRRILSEKAVKPGAGIEVLEEALNALKAVQKVVSM